MGDVVSSPAFDDVNTARQYFLDVCHQYWLYHARFTWQWWFLVITITAVWVLWWRVVDKKRIHLIANFGLIFALFAVMFDMIGLNHSAWAYPIRIYWALDPPLLISNITYLPVAFMLVYQRYGGSTPKLFTAFTLTSAIISFVFEPLYSWLGIYEPITWKFIYSFPTYIALAMLVRLIVGILENAEKKAT